MVVDAGVGGAEVLREGVFAELMISGVLPVIAWTMPTTIAKTRKRAIIPRHPRQERILLFTTLFWEV